MADEPQEGMESEGGAGPSSSKSKLSLKTLILIGLPLVMVQAVIAYFIVTSYISPRLPEAKPRVEQKTQQADGRTASEIDLSKHAIISVEDVIVNPAGSQGQRYLSVSVVLYVPSQVEAQITLLEPEIRSVIIEQISRKRLDELDDYRDQQILREEIREHLNALLKNQFGASLKGAEIPRLVFSKYTLQ